MKALWSQLEGKKTYLSAAGLFMLALVALWFHLVDPTEAVALIGIAAGIASLGHKTDRQAQFVVAELVKIRDAQDKKAALREIAGDMTHEVVDETLDRFRSAPR